MEIGQNLQYKVPDECPEDCKYKNSFLEEGQSAICGRCPIFNCREVPDEDGYMFSLVSKRCYRNDWAKEWEEFFKTGKEPVLRLRQPDAHVIKDATQRGPN